MVLIITLSLYELYRGCQKEQLLKGTGKYTIGVIEKIKVGSKGMIVFISYYSNNKKIETNIITDYENKGKLHAGKRIFIKYILKRNEKFIQLDFDCIVPGSIKTTLANGWTKEWMKQHFPGYVKL